MLLLLLLACADSKIQLDDIHDASDVEDLCAEYDHEDLTLEVVFPAQEEACPWGEDDNTGPSDGIFTARVEQSESLSVPENAVVCDMAFDFSGLVPDEVQVMAYDDHFFFAFDDVVLAASYGPAVGQLEEEDELRRWDWSRIVGTDYHADPDYDAYCLGEESGRGECDIPETESEGEFILRYDEPLVAELSARAIAESRYDFAFVTVGDDDPQLDCRHEEFGFTVDVPYVQL